MRDSLTHRGPDDAGLYVSPDRKVALGNRRLAIIDLSPAGHQPLCNEQGTVWITYNGEVYNFQELYRQLVAKGHIFKSHTDTEVIVHGYEEWGIEELLARLRGMFAFAIYDGRVQGRRDRGTGRRGDGGKFSDSPTLPLSTSPRLILARDRFGIKPLYYYRVSLIKKQERNKATDKHRLNTDKK